MESKAVVSVLGALAHGRRLAIFRLLIEHGPNGVPAGAIGERLGLVPATLSFHLKELARTGLIAARQSGRFIWYRADFDAMNDLVGYLTENCCRATGESCCVPIPKPHIVARRKQETNA
jgi:DNA-binding transcriptional ArsR family regulator